MFKLYPQAYKTRTFKTSYEISFQRPKFLLSITITAKNRDKLEISGVFLAHHHPLQETPALLIHQDGSIERDIQLMHPMLRTSLGDYSFPPDLVLFRTHLLQGKVAMASDVSS